MYFIFYICINNFDGIDIIIVYVKKKIDLYDVIIMFCIIYEVNWF